MKSNTKVKMDFTVVHNPPKEKQNEPKKDK